MTNLTLLHESTVKESEIDSLGHMNVRFYVERAAAAHLVLHERLGIAPTDGQRLRRIDTYNRFHREQFAGARLHTLGGLVATESRDGVTGYYEIRNVETNDVAASFVLTTEVVDAGSLRPVGPAPRFEPEAYVELPGYGRPRSLTLAPPNKPSFEEIEPMIHEDTASHMSGRREGIVVAEDCDETGRLKEEKDLITVLFRPQPGEELKQMGPPHLRDENGRLYSWAMMEIRNLVFERPREGDTVISLSADIDYGNKWRISRRWMFSNETKTLLGISDSTALCLDLEARRALDIPEPVRASLEKHCLRNYA